MRLTGKHSFDSWSIEKKDKKINVGKLVFHKQMFKVNLMSFMEAPAPSAMAPVLASPGAELLGSSSHIRDRGSPEEEEPLPIVPITPTRSAQEVQHPGTLEPFWTTNSKAGMWWQPHLWVPLSKWGGYFWVRWMFSSVDLHNLGLPFRAVFESTEK